MIMDNSYEKYFSPDLFVDNSLCMKLTILYNSSASEIQRINVTVGMSGRTSSAPISAHSLIVDKAQSLRSGILTYINLVLHVVNVRRE